MWLCAQKDDSRLCRKEGPLAVKHSKGRAEIQTDRQRDKQIVRQTVIEKDRLASICALISGVDIIIEL